MFNLGQRSMDGVGGLSTNSDRTDDCAGESSEMGDDYYVGEQLDSERAQDDDALVPISTSSRHTMTTRSKLGFIQLNPRYTLQISASPTVPSNVNAVKDDLKWNNAMLDKMEALKRNHTLGAGSIHDRAEHPCL